MKTLLPSLAIIAALLLGGMASDVPIETGGADVIIVGAGIAGLSAALELGRGGASVLVLDMNSVAGGHAVLAGGYALVGTPLQEELGIEDSPERAFNDLMAWGETNDPEWTRFYVENSKELVYDWLVDLGIRFVNILAAPSHSVPRFHFTKGTSAFVVVPLMQEIFKQPNVGFLSNREVKEIVFRDGAISGVIAMNLRSNAEEHYSAPYVIVATGGFQSDLDFVERTWPKDLPFPNRILIGSGEYATGSGYELADKAGAALSNLDRHVTFPSGIPNPRALSTNDAVFARNPFAIWLNGEGQRFADESDTAKFTVPIIARQTAGTYWVIYDEASKAALGARGPLWLTPEIIKAEIANNPQITKSAPTLEGLAEMIGLPPDAVRRSIERYNGFVQQNADEDFGRSLSGGPFPAQKIETPPFYAMQSFLVTRKSMGGISIDMSAQALDDKGAPIAGLYAAGEVTGVAGINGSVGMSGTFLGPSVMIGRIAARAILGELGSTGERPTSLLSNAQISTLVEVTDRDWVAPFDVADLKELLSDKRSGYWHFETAHELVLERNYDCTSCHSSNFPMKSAVSKVQLLSQSKVCTTCHN